MDINILIAEDEDDIRALLDLHLSNKGYKIFQASNGIEALEILSRESIHLLILDVMMPKMNGFETIKKIRETNNMPVIFLTAMTEEANKILGLGLGADDYVIKPFSIIEIISRVEAHLRRYMKYSTNEFINTLSNGELILNLENYEFKKKGIVIELLPKEFNMLVLFMKNIGRVFTKKQLYEAVWEEEYLGDDNTIMVHISNLREKIEDNPRKPKYLKTIRGVGYRMVKSND
ncbi:response regulator transcription factor [Paramaledivibacter caminithermalis]|jgi:DNA-binding response OmpR family regulator|uniref:Stage 0 sporulation protein A homolog n=1 Tax=Paramaledivibacter caminithermalis (strain DSM 15212 / CIP 107654 / DViRD3) TaxID=1121301 RepID=A0A1M6TIQ9_PARC5|nr:response regulator transcription factor [Paramaledivibacter caminithermalis]SHK56820.1 DNA-binding response regulator, OmpR family, contains REC and winged-helix (wHTH) domain [Paramaledivibacter caminithermalis DSM 15212]